MTFIIKKRIAGSIISLCVIAMWGILISGCSTAPAGRVNHVVICWLIKPDDQMDRQAITDAAKSFRTIPGVIDVRIGKSIPSDRKIVDDSFDVAIFVTFENTDDMKAYIVHPLHEKAKREVLLPLVKKVTVYDFAE